MESENNLKSKNIQTYTGDMVRALGSNQGGIVKKLIHQEEDKKLGKQTELSKSKKNTLFLIVGLVLFLAGILVLYFLFAFSKNLNTSPVMPESSGIIYTEKNIFQKIDGLSKESAIKAFFNEVANINVKPGGIEAIYLTEGNAVINTKRFMDLVKSELDQIHTSVFSNNFMLGAMNETSNNKGNQNKFFVLLGTRSFDDVFPVMKIWERKMFHDLSLFLGIGLSPSTNYLFTKDWENGIVQNKNARILRDQEGNIVLMYVYITNQNVLITNSEITTKEIMLRLATGGVKK